MTSDKLDIPQITMVGAPDDNPFSFAPSCPSTSLGGSRLVHLRPSRSPTDKYSSPISSDVTSTSVLRSARNPLDTSDSRSHASVNSSSPLSSPSAPTGPRYRASPGLTPLTGLQRANSPSTLSTDLINDNPKARGLSTHAGKGNVGVAIKTPINGSSPHGRLPEEERPHLPSRAAHSDAKGLLSHTHAHVDASLDARSSAVPRPSSVTGFFRRTVHRVRRPSGESDTGLCTTTNSGQKGRNADVKRKRHQLARPAVLDLKQEADQDFLQKQSIMNNLEERLDTAKKLRGEAADLKLFFESGTVAAMEDLRATVLPRPLPQDNSLFKEANLMLAEIRGSYEELNIFWKEEAFRAAKVLKERRTDLRDFECWNSFYSSLKLAIELWKNQPPSGDAQNQRSNKAFPSTGVDLAVIVSSLSPTIGSFEDTLERMSSCESLQYSPLGRSSFQRVYIAFAGNSDLCLSFLQHCADYGEKVMALHRTSVGSTASSHMGASVGRSDMTGVSAKAEVLEGAGGVGEIHGSRTQLTQCLGAEMPPIRHLSPGRTLQSFNVSRATDKDLPKPDIMISPPAGEATEDRQRILGQNTLPQRASQSLHRLMCLPLRDKVLVLLSIYVVVSLSLSLFKEFGTNSSSENHR